MVLYVPTEVMVGEDEGIRQTELTSTDETVPRAPSMPKK